MTWKYLQLSEAGRRLARIPRFARLMSRLPDAEFRKLNSPGQVYWTLYSWIPPTGNSSSEGGLFHSGLLGQAGQVIGIPDATRPTINLDYRKWQIECCFAMAGAIAFAMTGRRSDKPQDQATDVGQLRKEVINMLCASGPTETVIGETINRTDWHNWLDQLFKMDSHDLRYITFSQAGSQQIVWADISVRAFFAAVWACRWASHEQLQNTWKWIPYAVRTVDKNELGEAVDTNQDYLEFWRMAIDLPKGQADPLDGDWFPQRTSLLSPIYDGTLCDEEKHLVRSSELICAAWSVMRETDAVKKFEGEFEELLAGDRGEEKQVIAQNLLAGFLSLCVGRGGEHDRGEFQMGAPDGECREWDRAGAQQNNPLHPVRLSGYFLHRFCVTNEEYELFDARHKSLREFENKKGVKSVDRHPVLNVSSWDGLAFGLWLGERKIDGIVCRFSLPTEAQWEYACRCGEATPFSWGLDGAGERRDGNRIESAYCNFDGNFPWQPGAGSALSEGPYLERTIAVDGAGELEVRVTANPWGFWQMHGNAWEWCRDWYDGGFYRTAQAGMMDLENTVVATYRVLRGGGWIDLGRHCRSSYQSRGTPWFRSRYHSFRLAAVPCEPSK